jgi:hypothetical protein
VEGEIRYKSRVLGSLSRSCDVRLGAWGEISKSSKELLEDTFL